MGKRDSEDTAALQSKIGVFRVFRTDLNVIYPGQHIRASCYTTHTAIPRHQTLCIQHICGQTLLRNQPHGKSVVRQNPNRTRLRPRKRDDSHQKTLQQWLQIGSQWQVFRQCGGNGTWVVWWTNSNEWGFGVHGMSNEHTC
jgi:hypothetical protein